MTLKALFGLLLRSPEAAQLGKGVVRLLFSNDKKKVFVGRMLDSLKRIGKTLGRAAVIFDQVDDGLDQTTKIAIVTLYDDLTEELEAIKDACQEFESDTGVSDELITAAINTAREKLGAIKQQVSQPPQREQSSQQPQAQARAASDGFPSSPRLPQ